MTVTLVGQVLALLAVVAAAQFLHRLTRLELTLACVLCGFLAGLGVEMTDFDTGVRAHSLEDVVFFVILPVLIFEASWHIKPRLLLRWMPPVLLLATMGVLVSCFVSAAVLYFGIGHASGFPWEAALLAGAILAATDPVSVVGQLRSHNAPAELAILFEGESLFNDATAVVLFTLILSLAMTPSEPDPGIFLGHFAMVFFGGIALGLIVGFAACVVITIERRRSASVFVVMLTAFGSFYLAEHLLHVSGIMAVMMSSLLLRWRFAESTEDALEGVGITLDWLGETLNNLLYVIMGLVITLGMFESRWLAMLVAIGAALLGRAAAVGTCSLLVWPLPSRISGGWQLLLTWGGLRGAIAIALVLALPVELDYWYTVQSMVFGVVLFSLLVQGTTNGLLISRFAVAARETHTGEEKDGERGIP